MGLKKNRKGRRKTPEDSYYRQRLKEGACAPEHSIILKKGITHSNSLEDYGYNPSPGVV